MKKIAIISLLLLVCPLIRAIEYTVDKVPNVHLDDVRRFVSNPDGILSAETVNTLDQMLFSLQEANTSEVAVVALQSIGDNDIDDFATELFTQWGRTGVWQLYLILMLSLAFYIKAFIMSRFH